MQEPGMQGNIKVLQNKKFYDIYQLAKPTRRKSCSSNHSHLCGSKSCSIVTLSQILWPYEVFLAVSNALEGHTPELKCSFDCRQCLARGNHDFCSVVITTSSVFSFGFFFSSVWKRWLARVNPSKGSVSRTQRRLSCGYYRAIIIYLTSLSFLAGGDAFSLS